MQDTDIESLRAAIASLEAQRGALGDAVLELATAPLRARLAGLLRPAGLQHRQVTVLFADVVGSTAMAQRLGAEDTLNVLSGALRRMAALVEAHQGRVLRFTGDGLKAAFGMDEAREDDAERAVRAGLAILQVGREEAEQAQRQLGIAGFAVRVGVHTGDVALGAGVEADNTAMGAAVNIAARMEQSAPPGTLRISQDTWSQVRGLFALEVQPPLQVKGVEAPMRTYLVHAALDRSVASVERGVLGLSTPMVGRDAELQRLLDSVTLARASRQLQALTLVGDAGLGKSRLLREFAARLTDCRVLLLRSQPDGALRLFGLLRSLLATQCGVADTDSAEVARRKVVDGLGPSFPERGERQAQLMGQLSGLDFSDSLRGLDPRALRDQAFAAVRAYLQALAAPGGTLPVLIVEDLHWADDGSLDLLQHLLAHATELPLALVMAARPALLARRPDWCADPSRVQLSPLPAAQSDALVQMLLQRIESAPPRLAELILRQADGNPYYMEELLRRLIDDDVIVATEPRWTVRADRLDTVRLPTTLIGLLQARLDALPADERQAARQASVIGHVFWDDALRALDARAPQALPALQRAAFVRSHATSDVEGTPERQFDHHLLHQVTYDTLLNAERKHGHSAAARWLSERTQGRGAEFLAMTGEHAERAGETALAVDCFERAGLGAMRRFANTAARSWLRRALALLGDSEPFRRVDLLDQLQRLADVVGDRPAQEALLQDTAALLERHPDDRRQAELLFSSALLADRRSDFASAERLCRQSLELAERCHAAYAAAMSHAELAYLTFAIGGDTPAAIELVKVGLQWAGRIEGNEERRLYVEGQFLTLSAMFSSSLGQHDAARDAYQAVLLRGEQLVAPRLQLGALTGLANLEGGLGRWEEMAVWAAREFALGQSVGVRETLAIAWQHMGQAATGRGDHAEAIRCQQQALDLFRATGNRQDEARSLREMADAFLARGEASAALPCYAESQAICTALPSPLRAAQAAAGAARCQACLGQADAALSEVDRVLAQLQGKPGHDLATEIDVRWNCFQVLDAVGDARAAGLLEKLYADVLAHAAASTFAADRDRLIQALPVFRAIMATQGRRGRPLPAR
jgi:class 3 adenylate cyclase/tetratricopeptide (TPR) repeat protein